MIAFYNLDEAFNYRRYCPCKNCGHPLFPEITSITHSDKTHHVEFAFGDVTLIVGLYNNTIISYEKKSRSQTIYSIHNPYRVYSLSQQGTDIFPITVSCDLCHGYKYIIQVHTSLAQGCLVGLVLNSETIAIDKYTITNIYTTEKTELIIHSDSTANYYSKDRIEYPLISLNIEEPMKTVERLKKLVVFS